jgi:hypothetical protein
MDQEQAPNSNRSLGPRINAVSDPISVPVFNCIVYISKEDQRVFGRIANLPDITFQGESEPDVLRQLVKEFKQRISTWLEAKDQIPWIEPPAAILANEQQRLIPVHL